MKNEYLVILSEQSYEEVNRKIYSLLNNLYSKLTVLIPFDKNRKPPANLDPWYISIPVRNYHPRKSYNLISKKFVNDIFLMDSILLESDFHTLTCLKVVLFKIFFKKKLKVSLLTFENIYKDYKDLSLKSLYKIKFKQCFYFFMMHLTEKIFSKYINNIFTVSQDSYDIHKRKFKITNIIKTPLGIDSSIFFKYPKINQKLTIAFMGRIISNKNPHLVIDIFEMLIKKFQNIKLIFQDPKKFSGEYSKNISKRLISLKEKNYLVDIVDPCHMEMPKYLNQIDILIVPSSSTENYKEQYGRVIVEAKLCGALVLSSSSGAFPEVNGFDNQIFNSTTEEIYEKVNEFILLKIKSPKAYNDLINKSINHALQFQTVESQFEIYNKNL